MLVYIVVLFSWSCFSLWGMQKSIELQEVFIHAPIGFPEEIQRKIIQQSSLSVIGRFGQTSLANNKWYHDFVSCKNIQDMGLMYSIYSSYLDNFDGCTKALVFYAKESKNNPTNKQSFLMFQHLWQYHENARMEAIKNVREIGHTAPIQWKDILDVYSGKYPQRSDTGNKNINKEIDATIKTHLKEQLQNFLLKGQLVEIKTLFLTNFGWFDGHHEILKLVHLLDDVHVFDILQLMVTHSRVDCLAEAIKCMVLHHRIDLLKLFIEKHRENAINQKFYIWNRIMHALSDPSKKNKNKQYEIYEIISSLFSSQEVDEIDSNQKTLLLYAISYNNKYAVQFLLEKGANPNQKSKESPLFVAQDKPSIITLLLKHGADINQTNIDGRSLLIEVADSTGKHTQQAMELLLQNGANVNQIDDRGCCALHYILRKVSYRTKERVSLLLRYGARVDLCNKEGKIPLDYVPKNADVLKILQNQK